FGAVLRLAPCSHRAEARGLASASFGCENADRQPRSLTPPWPLASSVSLANLLLGRLTSPSQAAIRAETRIRVHEGLHSMDALDREVLTLRHFEMLSNDETAQVLGISKKAASKRFTRALERLQEILSLLPGFSASGPPQ